MNNRMMDDVTAGSTSSVSCAPHSSERCKSCGSTSQKDQYALDQLIQKGNFLNSILGGSAGSDVKEDASAKLKALIAEL